MTKKIYILVLFSVLCSAMFGQFVGKDNLSVSLYYMQKSELDSAQKYIDLAMNDDGAQESAKMWYYRGFIYKDIYKNKEKSNKQSPARLSSIDAFKKMLPLDVDNEFTESGKKILKYLASTLYNDAVRSLTPDSYPLAISNFDLYKEAIKIATPEVDIKAQDVKFKLALASMLNRPAASGEGLDSAQTEQVKQLYIDILDIDPKNPGANYNLATLYYNEAADIINNMDYDMDIEKLNQIQDYCIEIFLKGLPYMKTSYELNYKRKETLIGLSNIYYGLNDVEKSEHYKRELDILDKREAIQQLEKKINSMEKNGEADTDNYKEAVSQLKVLQNELQTLMSKHQELEK